MRFYKAIIYCLLTITLLGCAPDKRDEKQISNTTNELITIKYAKGFTIQQYKNYKQIIVRNPWDTTQVLDTYILVDRNKPLPENLPQGTVVKVPVQKVATCSALFAGEYKKLGAINKIVAVGEPEYVYIPEIVKGIANAKIYNLGMNSSINIEKLLASRAEVIIVSPFETSIYNRFAKIGIAVLKDASYMEESPLGRTEWIKFEAAFLQADALAKQYFDATEKRYNAICKKVMNTQKRPTVFLEKKTGDTWYVAGGKSYMGAFLKDAGANYIWSEIDKTGSVPYSFEKVYSKAITADFWLIKYNNPTFQLTLNQLAKEYDLYKNFKAFVKKQVYAVNAANTQFYELGPLEPDVVLSDLVNIFHPELFKNYQPKYYLHVN